MLGRGRKRDSGSGALGRHACALLAACGLAAALSTSAVAQDVDDTGLLSAIGRGGVAIDQIDGRAWAGVNAAAPLQTGGIEFAALRAFAWNVGSTRRLVLDADVRVTLASFHFVADRAVVWVEPLEVVDPDAPDTVRDAHQVAVYFERVRTPGVAPGTGLAQQGERLLVTALLAGAPPRLDATVLDEGRPVAVSDAFLADAEARFARHLRRLLGEEVVARPPLRFELPTRAGAERVVAERRDAPIEADALRIERPGGVPLAESARRADEPAFDTRDDVPPYDGPERAPAPAQRLAFSAGEVAYLSPDRVDAALAGAPADEGDTPAGAVALAGGVTVILTPADPVRERGVELRAQRVVIFVREDAADRLLTGSLEADIVTGVYLEGDVLASDGSYTLRGDRFYFDPATRQGIALDAVFSTFDDQRGMPLYVRADEIRQVSERQWRGENVLLANVAFAEPHFAIGVSEVTITRPTPAPSATGRASDAETPPPLVDARGVSFRVGDVPVFGVPRVRGELRPSPLRSVQYENFAGDNAIRTRWDLLQLLGVEIDSGTRAELLLDGFIERGPAVGVDLAWDRPTARGGVFGYGIFDNGEDRLTSGADLKRDDDLRGVITAENAWRVNGEWTIFAEGSYISDEAFIDAFFEREAESRREFINSLYFRRIRNNHLIGLEVRGTLNDFIANEYLLQSQGYTTQRFPELRVAQVGQELFGLFSYTGEARAGLLALSFHEPRLRDIGLDTRARAGQAFGLRPRDRLSDRLEAQGLSESSVFRFDTRHEVSMPLSAGALNIVPFAVGRFTWYDDDFEDFRGDDDLDSHRLWSAAGLRLSTSLVRTDPTFRSQLFDLNGMRHIIEPHLTVWQGASTIDPSELPVYDESVESIADGTVVSFGARQTWQTKRGGALGQYTVDWLVLETTAVYSSDDTPIDSPFGFFYSARPERSNLGDFIQIDGVLRLTNATSLTWDVIHDFENSQTARVAVGGEIDHGRGFTTFAQFRYLEGFDNTRLRSGVRYELTRKYALELANTWDLDDSDIQRLDATFVRRFPQWTVTFGIDLDNVGDRVGFGVTARPAGFAGEERARVYTDDEALTPDRSASSLRRGRVGGPFDAGT